MAETRARRKIREAAESWGLTIDFMEWQPIGQMVEKSGREGGWTVFFKEGGHALGYSADDVVENIQNVMRLEAAETAISQRTEEG